LEESEFFFLAAIGLAVVIVAVTDRFGEEDAGLEVGGRFFNKFAVDLDGGVAVFLFVGFFGGFDVEAFGFADLFFERDGFGEGLPAVVLGTPVGEEFGAVDAPVAHGAVGVDANRLFEGADGFVVPEVVEEIQSLVEPYLGFGSGGDFDVGVANAGEFFWGREFFGGDFFSGGHRVAWHWDLGGGLLHERGG